MDPIVIRFEIGISPEMKDLLTSTTSTMAAAAVMTVRDALTRSFDSFITSVRAGAAKAEPKTEEPEPKEEKTVITTKVDATAPESEPVTTTSAAREVPDSELTAAVDRAKSRGVTNTQLKSLLTERNYTRILACPQDQREDFIMAIDNL